MSLEKVQNQFKERKLFEVLDSCSIRGSFLATGRRVGRQAQIITTFNSIRDQRRNVVKSSAKFQNETAIIKRLELTDEIRIFRFLCELCGQPWCTRG